MTPNPEIQIVGGKKSDEGHLALFFSNGCMAVVHDSPPTDEVVIEVASRFMPGREPFHFRRSDRIPNVVYIYPTDVEIPLLTDDERAWLDDRFPARESF